MKRILITFSIFLALLVTTASPASAQDCADVSGVGRVCAKLVNDEVVVTVLGVQVAKLDAPVVHSTLRVEIPGPRVTVSRPPVRIPGPTRTVVKPGPTRTIFITRDGRTVTVSPNSTIGQTTKDSGRVSTTPSPHPTPPAASPKVRVIEKERTVTISLHKAVGFSVGLVMLGILIALVALWLIYIVGYQEGSEGDKKFLREFLNDLRRRS